MGKEFYNNNQIILENHLVKLIPFEEKYKKQLKNIIYDEEVYYTIECKNDAELDKYIDETVNQRILGYSYPFLVIDKRTH